MDSPATTKERILLFAARKFTEEGYVRVSIDDIASGLGISKKTFYKHFKSKEDLLLQLTDSFMRDIHTRITTIIGSGRGFLERLSAIMLLLAEQVGRVGTPFMEDIQKCRPEIWMRIQEFRRQRISVDLAGLIREGVREGQIRPDVNTELFAKSFIGAVEEVIVPSFLATQPYPWRDAIKSVLSIFFEGILTDEARRRLAEIQGVKT